MRIGITFDLRDDYAIEGYDDEQTAEFDRIETIVAIESALQALGHTTDRIGRAHALTRRLALGERWDLVFNIAECMHGFGRQALVPALLESYGIPYTFSDPLALCVTLHKATAKRVVRDCGISTPQFAVVNLLEDVEHVALPFPLFIKPIAEGTSKGISAASKVTDSSSLKTGCSRLLARFHQPVLVEAYMSGREFTVGIIGSGSDARILGVMELFLGGTDAGVYSYDSKKYFDDRVSVKLATDDVATAASELARAAWQCLGGRDAGRIDIRCDQMGQPNFLEANPLAGLHPTDSDLPLLGRLQGMPYNTLIQQIISSASVRLLMSRPPKSAAAEMHHEIAPS